MQDSPVVFPPFWSTDYDMERYYSQTRSNFYGERVRSKVAAKKAEVGCSHVSKYVFMLGADVEKHVVSLRAN